MGGSGPPDPGSKTNPFLFKKRKVFVFPKKKFTILNVCKHFVFANCWGNQE